MLKSPNFSLKLLTCGLFSSVDGVVPPTSSTQVFYISVSVCCIVIFLVAIILAILHLHSMKRVEMEDRFVSLARPGSKEITPIVMESTLIIVKLKKTSIQLSGFTASYLSPVKVILVLCTESLYSKTNKNRPDGCRQLCRYQCDMRSALWRG